MAIITLDDARRKVAAATLCDAGADTSRGRTQPGAWVAIAIRSVGVTTPDANGRMLHAVIRFAIPPAKRRAGKRRGIVDTWYPRGSALDKPIEIALDHGTGWIGTAASVYLRGGMNGDTYDVTITENVPRDETDPERVIDVYEDPFRFRLTSYFVVGGDIGYAAFPVPPAYHQWFYVVQGTARMVTPAGNIPLSTSYGPDGKIPLSAAHIEVMTGIYVTEGAV